VKKIKLIEVGSLEQAADEINYKVTVSGPHYDICIGRIVKYLLFL